MLAAPLYFSLYDTIFFIERTSFLFQFIRPGGTSAPSLTQRAVKNKPRTAFLLCVALAVQRI